MSRPLCLSRQVERIGKPSACTLQHLMIDCVGEILLAKHLRLAAQFLNQICEQRYLVVQTKLQRRKSGLHHAGTRMARLGTQHLLGKLVCLVNSTTVERHSTSPSIRRFTS